MAEQYDEKSIEMKIGLKMKFRMRERGCRLSLLILFGGISCFVQGQETEKLTLDACYELAEKNYPLVKQRELIEQSKEYSVANISKGYLPQLSVNGQGTFQSSVTSIPISFPGVDIPTIPKNQFKLYGEVNQPLTDLLIIKDQKDFQEIQSSIQSENLETELYKIRERINQLFFGVLLIDEQLRQNELFKKDIQTGIDRLSAAIDNGVEYKSSLDKLKAELLRVRQHDIELTASKGAYLDMLGLFIARELDPGTELEKPSSPELSPDINRPELSVFELQQQALYVQNTLITARTMPHLGLFFQGGIGRPNPVNLFSTDVSSYYIGGVRLSWSLSNFYTLGKEKKIIGVNQGILQSQRETFLFNTNLVLKQEDKEIAKLKELLQSDDEIVVLRESVKNTAEVQLQNGVITANDYLREINAEDQARQTKLLHEIQLLMAQYRYQNVSGN